MSKVYIIEGLPGSGKSTYSRRLETYLKSTGKRVKRYSEGDLHPVDLAWIAVTDEKTFDNLCESFSDQKEEILSNTKRVGDRYYTAYTKIGISDANHNPHQAFAAHSIYKTRDLKTFFAAHMDLWETFGRTHQPDTIYVFECVFLQNHINQLIASFNVDFEEMVSYFDTLIKTLDRLDPVILYIDQKHIEKTLQRLVEERRSPDHTLYKDWIDQVLDYMETLPYAKERDYVGYDGLIRYFKDRRKHERAVLEKIGCKHHVITLDGDYEAVFTEMRALIERDEC